MQDKREPTDEHLEIKQNEVEENLKELRQKMLKMHLYSLAEFYR